METRTLKDLTFMGRDKDGSPVCEFHGTKFLFIGRDKNDNLCFRAESGDEVIKVLRDTEYFEHYMGCDDDTAIVVDKVWRN